MATVYSTAGRDGRVDSALSGTFEAARSHAGGNYDTSSRYNNCGSVFYGGRGGGSYGIQRGAFEFDTSGISIAPSSATLRLYGVVFGTSDVIAVRGIQSASLGAGDFDAIYGASTALGNSDGSGAGTLAGISGLAYSSEVTSWNTSGYNDFVLNATARADMASLNDFKIITMNYDYDYLDITNGTSFYVSRAYNADEPGTSYDPYIDYTAGVAVTDNAVFFGANF